RICGSLDIGEALWQCLLYARGVMPADEVILTVYDPSLGALEIAARTDEKGFITKPDRVRMPSQVKSELENVEQYPRTRICNDITKDPIAAQVAIHFKWPQCSAIVTRLIIQHKFIGSLIVRANGKDRYDEGHAELWALVNEPAGIALANSRQYLELLKLKEALADDNRYLHNELRRTMGAQIVGANFGLKEVMDQVYK